MTKRPIFSSQLATILTLIGVAVGLGNVCRFSYMMGKYLNTSKYYGDDYAKEVIRVAGYQLPIAS